MIEFIRNSYVQFAGKLQILPSWLLTSLILVAAVALASVLYAAIIATMRSTFGLRHPNTRALLTRSKGPLRLGLIVLALALSVRVAPINADTAKVLGNDSFRYVREMVDGDDALLEFTAELDGIHVNGIDLIRFDGEGKIADFKVMVRPLKAVNKLWEQMAARLQAAG